MCLYKRIYNNVSRLLVRRATFLLIFFLSGYFVQGQTNPTAQSLPYSQDFGTTTFTSMPTGMAAWQAKNAPKSSQSAAESSIPKANASVTAATSAQTTAGCYGYCTSSNGRLYLQASGTDTTNGTNQAVLAVATTAYNTIKVSYKVEMIAARVGAIGVVLQYRVGTTGSWTTVTNSSYSHGSSDRSAGAIDRYLNLSLPSSVDNNSNIQLRWATWTTTRSSSYSGVAIDSIRVTGSVTPSLWYFRSKQTGNWNSASTWEMSTDNSNWINATVFPDYQCKSINIQSGHTVTLTASDTIDEVTINGTLCYGNNTGSTLTINNGTGTDLTINGTFQDYGPNSIAWSSSARWVFGSSGTIIRTRSTSSDSWRDNYYNGISNIPSTANWIIRKTGTDNPLVSSTGSMYYPNLIIENDTASVWTTTSSSSFSGTEYIRVMGNLDIGGNGSGYVSFLDENTNASAVYILGSLTVRSGSTLRNYGTGVNVLGTDLLVNGTISYGSSNNRLIQFAGTNNQQISGTGTIDIYNLTINKSSNNLTLGKSITVAHTLTLTSGDVILGAYDLTLGTSGTISGQSSGSYVQSTSTGKLIKKYSAASGFTFPLGDATYYSPYTLTFNSGTFGASAAIAIRAINSAESHHAGFANRINRYWEVGITDITNPNASASYIYVDSDITGAETSFVSSRWNATNNLKKVGTVSVSSNTANVPSGVFQAGNYSVASICSITAEAGSNQTINYGDSINITASGGASYVWSTGGTTATINVKPTSTTNYTVTATDSYDCTASDFVTITVQTLPGNYYFRSKQNGNWNQISSWQMSLNNNLFFNATFVPDYRCKSILISEGNEITFVVSDTIDEVTVSGSFSYADSSGCTMTINDGAGVDLTVNGDFGDLGPNNIVWLSNSTWVLGATGSILRTRSTSSDNWRDKYSNGISNIPSTANWIIAKIGSDSPILSSTGGMYYPNLIIGNTTSTIWTTSGNSSFNGSSDFPRIKGSLYVGGLGSGDVNFKNENTCASPTSVSGNLVIASGSILGNEGTGFDIRGNLQVDGTLNYGASNNRLISFSDTSSQQISGSGTINIYNLSINKSAHNLTLGRSLTIDNMLTLTSGDIVLGTYDLTLSPTAAISGQNSNSYVQSTSTGKLIKKYSSAGSAFTFPLGDATNYSPYTLTLNSGTYGAAAAISIRAINTAESHLTSFANRINRYWEVGINDISGAGGTVEYKYVDSDIVGAETNFVATGWNSTYGLKKIGTVSPSTNTANVSLGVYLPGNYSAAAICTLVADADSNRTINYGDSTSITATGGTSYYWSTGATTATISVKPSATTNYTVTITDNYSCSASDYVTVTVQTVPGNYYFKSRVSGLWNVSSNWYMSMDNVHFILASFYPDYQCKSITIQSNHLIDISQNDTIDEVIVNGGLTYYDGGSGTTLTINDGPGIDLTVNGTFYDQGANSIVWLSSAVWVMGDTGNIVRTRSTSADNWRDKYSNGISTIPENSNWWLRKTGTDEPLLTSDSNMYYPNLIIQNECITVWTTSLNSSLRGGGAPPTIKGSLKIINGGKGNRCVNFLYQNNNATALTIPKDLVIETGSNLRLYGTGLDIYGDMNIEGTLSYDNSDSRLIRLLGSNVQNVNADVSPGILKLEINKTANNAILRNTLNVDSLLTLVKGDFVVGNNQMIFSPTTVVLGASDSSYIQTNGNGYLQRKYQINHNDLIYPIGDANYYTPISFHVDSLGIGANPMLYFRTVGSSDPSLMGFADRLNRYWAVSGRDLSFASGSVTYTYNDADIIGNESNYVATRWFTYDSIKCIGTVNPQTNTVYGGPGLMFANTFSAGGICNINATISGSDTNNSICFGDTDTLTVNHANSYHWSTNANTQSIIVSSSGAYSVTVTGQYGCTAVDTINIIVHPLPNISLTADTTIYLGAMVPLIASGGAEYTWNPTESLIPTGIDSEPIAKPNVTTTYHVLVEDSMGCAQTDSVTVSIASEPGIYSMVLYLDESKVISNYAHDTSYMNHYLVAASDSIDSVTNNISRALLKINLDSFPEGLAVLSAQLYFYIDSLTGENDFCFSLINQNWDEKTLNWSNQPTCFDTISDSIFKLNKRGLSSLDITEIMQYWTDSIFS